MHILIMDMLLGGHHSIYLEQITSKYIKAGHAVTIVINSSEKSHAVIQRMREAHVGTLAVETCAHMESLQKKFSSLGSFGLQLGSWMYFRQVYNQINARKQIDMVFLPYLDCCIYTIGILGSPFGQTQWKGVCMSQTFHLKHCGALGPRTGNNFLKRLLFVSALKSSTLGGLHSIDQLLEQYINRVYPKLRSRLKYVPDPSLSPRGNNYLHLRKKLEVPNNALLVMVYGKISERKGFGELLNAVISEPDLNYVHLLVVGVQEEAVKRMIAGLRVAELKSMNRFHEIDSFIDEELEAMAFSAADILWIGYKDHFTMSGVLVKAGMAEKPVIGTHQGLIGWYIKKYELGMAVNISNQDEIVLAIRELNSKEVRNRFGANGARSFAKHTWEDFCDKLEV